MTDKHNPPTPPVKDVPGQKHPPSAPTSKTRRHPQPGAAASGRAPERVRQSTAIRCWAPSIR